MGGLEPFLFINQIFLMSNKKNIKKKDNKNDKDVKKMTSIPNKIEEKKDIERDNFIKFSWSWIL
tara:strand:- start:892 stop:1083 length:192 start_codon:yes stop_codon:yes gene_type:complete